jgi:hypothetical protein
VPADALATRAVTYARRMLSKSDAVKGLLCGARLHWRDPLAPGGEPLQQGDALLGVLRTALALADAALPPSLSAALLVRVGEGLLDYYEAGVPSVRGGGERAEGEEGQRGTLALYAGG